MRQRDYRSATVELYPWGEVRWLHTSETGTKDLAFGEIIINPGAVEPPHYHPNCEEVLYLISGDVEHFFEESKGLRMKPGMSVHVPAGLKHNSRCTSDEPARLLVAYSSAHQQVVKA